MLLDGTENFAIPETCLETKRSDKEASVMVKVTYVIHRAVPAVYHTREGYQYLDL